jgi:DNA polymerase IV
MPHNIIHINIANFYIAVESVMQPSLRGRPVAVAIETTARSLVYAASNEARRNGVYRGMPMYKALKQCRDLQVLPPNEALYWRATQAMMDILGNFTPVLEPLRFGHAYLDMRGTTRLFGHVKDAAAKAQKEIRERLRLDASVGVAGNKLVSKVASDFIIERGDHFGLCDVRRGDEAPFLAPLRVSYLPGVRSKIHQELLDLNVKINGQLAAVPTAAMQTVFGRFGLLLHQRARGIDNRPVQPPKRAPEIVELHQLDDDSNDYDLLLSLLYNMLGNATMRLRDKALRASRLIVTVQYSDYKDNTAQQKFQPLDTEIEMAPVLRPIFERVLTRRLRVRKLTLRLRDLSADPQQLDLFSDAGDPKIAAVSDAMDDIRQRFGGHAIRFGRAA